MKRLVQIFVSLMLAGIVMYYLYHDFPFSDISHILTHSIDWIWVIAAMGMGAAAQLFRALRWQLLLKPFGTSVSVRNLAGAVFTSFALSLLIPRIGEISRCATLRKTNDISFSRSIGTVVTERIADTLTLLALIGAVFCRQWNTVDVFFAPQHANSSNSGNLTIAIVLAISIGAIVVSGIWALRKNKKFRSQYSKFKEGLLSVAHCGHPWLFTFYSMLICLFNLLNLWLMFYAFPFTAHLGADAALLAFCMIAFAMVIPTPNGAGPWHYVVMTSLIIYGVGRTNASTFALIVHALHMLTIILLGFAGMAMLRKYKPTH